MSARFDVVEASIARLRGALESGETSSVELVAAYLERIAAYDHHGPLLNAVPVLNPAAFAEARASDRRRAAGALFSPLDGIPYTAKDSYRVAGLPVSAGSPAFAELVAGDDAFAIERLRAAGAVCLGLTTMPPMANGGMQRGLHGRAESPYNPAYLTSAWASGSSNGSGTATAASFGAFGLGEETWSSGRAPANNNALCAYTPSWGVISLRGNWPLVPTMDVVVPHTRSMADLLELLDVLVADDASTRGDFWRVQEVVDIPKASAVRPASYTALAAAEGDAGTPLSGVTLGLPTMYLGEATAPGQRPIPTRASVAALARAAAQTLRDLGAEVVECDLPLIAAYEGDYAHVGGGFQGGLEDSGRLPRGFADAELIDLSAWALDDFLRSAAESAESSGPASLVEVEAELVFPRPHGQIPDEYGEDFGMGDYVAHVAAHGVRPPAQIPLLGDGLRGLDAARRELFEAWMDAEGLDALILPTSADIAPADADQDRAAHDIAWRNGTWVANGNLVWRHLGIPTVTVPMGVAEDIGMPFGLTFAGRAWDDQRLLGLAAAYEAVGPERAVPSLTPRLGAMESPAEDGVAVVGGAGVGEETFPAEADAGAEAGEPRLELRAESLAPLADGTRTLRVTLAADRALGPAAVSVNGVAGEPGEGPGEFLVDLPASSARFHSQWRPRYGDVVVATARVGRDVVGAYEIVGGC